MGWTTLAGVDWENNHVVVHVFDVANLDWRTLRQLANDEGAISW